MDITTKIGLTLLLVLAGFWVFAQYMSHIRMRRLAEQLGVSYIPFQDFLFFSRWFQIKGNYRGHEIKVWVVSVTQSVQLLVDGKSISVIRDVAGNRTPLDPTSLKSEIDKHIDSLN